MGMWEILIIVIAVTVWAAVSLSIAILITGDDVMSSDPDTIASAAELDLDVERDGVWANYIEAICEGDEKRIVRCEERMNELNMMHQNRKENK